MKKAAVVSQGGFTSNCRFSSCLTAPPNGRIETRGHMETRGRPAQRHPLSAGLIGEAPTGGQTSAIGRKNGPQRVRFFVAHDRHDQVKVNSSFRPVKIFFAISDSHWKN
jgi:hypothetical protein